MNAAALICGMILLTRLVVTPASCAEIKRHLMTDEAVAISIAGEIVEGDAEVLRLEIQRAHLEKYFISKVELNSIGGSLYEGTSIASIIRAASLITSVAEGDTCASVCFLAFAAGSAKYVQVGARVGVHAATIGIGEATEATIPGTAAMVRTAKLLGVPPGITQQMGTPASQMFWLNRADLISMGAIVTSSSPQPLPIGQAGPMSHD